MRLRCLHISLDLCWPLRASTIKGQAAEQKAPPAANFFFFTSNNEAGAAINEGADYTRPSSPPTACCLVLNTEKVIKTRSVCKRPWMLLLMRPGSSQRSISMLMKRGAAGPTTAFCSRSSEVHWRLQGGTHGGPGKHELFLIASAQEPTQLLELLRVHDGSE